MEPRPEKKVRLLALKSGNSRLNYANSRLLGSDAKQLANTQNHKIVLGEELARDEVGRDGLKKARRASLITGNPDVLKPGHQLAIEAAHRVTR